MLKHIDLFSGIGGFSYALDTVFYEQKNKHLFCDNNKFCQSVLKKLWPDAIITGDIRALTNTGSDEPRGVSSCEGQEVSTAWSSCDIVTGGFPCQPFSAAGRRQGTSDDRYLWPEMFRVIREFKPSWVVAENVRGLVTWNDGMVLEQVCADLESEGYEVQPLIIPAVAVNAPHRRDRVWFIANRAGDRRKWRGQTTEAEKRRETRSEQTGELQNGLERQDSNATNTKTRRLPEPRRARAGWVGFENKSWQKSWLEVATELCSVDDGLPGRMGRTTITKAAHRKEQLKAYGNAIVPQVAMEIFKAIKAVYY